MPKAIAQQPTHSGSVSIQPSDLPKLCHQPEKGPPTVPSHLALNSKERSQLQTHLDLVGVDRNRFKYTQDNQGAGPTIYRNS